MTNYFDLTQPTNEALEAQGRSRVSVDLSPTVIAHLDAISKITGVSRSQLIHNALLQQLPFMISHAQGLQWKIPMNFSSPSRI